MNQLLIEDISKEEEQYLLSLLEQEDYLSVLEESINKEEWINTIGI